MKLNFKNHVLQAYYCLSSLTSIVVSLIHALTQFIIILVFGTLFVAVLMMVSYVVGEMLITWLSIPITIHGYSKRKQSSYLRSCTHVCASTNKICLFHVLIGTCILLALGWVLFRISKMGWLALVFYTNSLFIIFAFERVK